MKEKRGEWTRLATEVAYENPYYRVRRDTVIKPDGSKGFYDVIETRGVALVVPLDAERNVHMFGLHKYTTDKFSMEVVAGGLDEDEEPLSAAKRELAEELGLVAGKWTQLGTMDMANGISSAQCYVFLAEDLESASEHGQKEEGITLTKKVPLAEAFNMVKSGEITDLETIASLTLAALEVGYIQAD